LVHKARIGGVLDAVAERPGEIFLAERIRRALGKLTPEERLLFSCLRSKFFTDKLIRDEEVNATGGGDAQVVMVQSVNVAGSTVKKKRKKSKKSKGPAYSLRQAEFYAKKAGEHGRTVGGM
jgi:hypothetical protein